MLLLITGLLYTVACLAVARWYLLRRRSALVVAGIALLLACIPAAGAGYDYAQRVDAVEHPLVVIADDNVLLRKGDGFNYPARSDLPLNRGVEARLLFPARHWLMVELGSGDVGWVPRTAALVDEP
jgi:hypothetical protein